MIPRNTTQHQRDTFVYWRTVIFSRWLHAKACTWRQFKLKIPRRMYKICTKFNQTRWILISWWKMKSGYQRVLCRDAGRSPLANIDPDQYIYFVHTCALCRRFSTLLQRFGHVTTKQVYTSVRWSRHVETL